jgi:hypothetical protein
MFTKKLSPGKKKKSEKVKKKKKEWRRKINKLRV